MSTAQLRSLPVIFTTRGWPNPAVVRGHPQLDDDAPAGRASQTPGRWRAAVGTGGSRLVSRVRWRVPLIDDPCFHSGLTRFSVFPEPGVPATIVCGSQPQPHGSKAHPVSRNSGGAFQQKKIRRGLGNCFWAGEGDRQNTALANEPTTLLGLWSHSNYMPIIIIILEYFDEFNSDWKRQK